MEHIIKIMGKKCYLTPVDSKYAETVAAWSNDMEVSILTGDASNMISVLKQKEYLEYMMNSDSIYAFIIVENENNKPVGFCRLKEVDLINRKAALGIFMGEKNYWNKGIGTEAIKLVLDYGFNIINLNNIWLTVFSYNENAKQVYKKIGFKEIGRRRNSIILGNKFFDEIFMDVLSDEFQGSILNEIV